jgi:hypothetical protein
MRRSSTISIAPGRRAYNSQRPHSALGMPQFPSAGLHSLHELTDELQYCRATVRPGLFWGNRIPSRLSGSLACGQQRAAASMTAD